MLNRIDLSLYLQSLVTTTILVGIASVFGLATVP